MGAHIWIATIDTNGTRSSHSTVAFSATECIIFAQEEAKRIAHQVQEATRRKANSEIVQIHRAEAVR